MIESAAITAALVGVILVLIKVIEWFMARKRPSAQQPYNGAAAKIDAKLDTLIIGLGEARIVHQQQLTLLERADGSLDRVIDRLDLVIDRLDRIADRLERK